MEENNVLETEVLNVIPEELKEYLKKDEEVLEEIDGVIEGLDNDIINLNNEREESEKDFDRRLEEFKDALEKERKAALDDFAKKAEDIMSHKTDIEKIKFEQQGKQVNYVDSLKDISSTYDSKISSIEEAIKACEDNDTLTKALDEEKNKKLETLEKEYDTRKEELSKVLEAIGRPEEPELEETKEEESHIEDSEVDDTPISLDVKNVEIPEIAPSFDTEYKAQESFDTEVVSHEPREDVINVIYESEDVMEGHVFPYLRSLV